ncbi:mechanosensitive ion channel family protein [Microbacterium foliorum]|uniref:mechanosensitive ion channel family protein n=1 Tax=Microbacterium foliorum TaxID=104336 RepID=UPI001DFEFD1E|nr:mechanosensitive ion channel domain-containing protein [Microbacterium foliorum]CAH0139861.1 Miniconductance mechanosensitive channel MscM [Microbacterium foliorum]CAH0188996.1 Miniconductance mechanosensitive channel MscM [Microbacterium foliorum]
MPSDFTWDSWIGTAAALGIAIIAAAAALVTLALVAGLIGRRVPWVRDLARRIRNAMIVMAAVSAIWIALSVTEPAAQSWWPAVSRLFLIATILTGSWLVAASASFGFERLIDREESALVGPEARRRRTQLLVIHRLVLVTIAVLALGAVLFTFPEMRAVGTSLLASAGIVSIIAGLAAQSILGNLIAGVQVAFTDAIKVGDVVVIQGEWGRIGEINLSYVVVYIWDERRLVVPCSYFTTTPIETWTRRSDKILGTVYLDLDWRVPMDDLRAEFARVVEASPAWDRRSLDAVVTEAQGGFVTVRLVMSAKDSGDQWALRCEVREKMIGWLQREHPEALPRTRVDIGAARDAD